MHIKKMCIILVLLLGTTVISKISININDNGEYFLHPTKGVSSVEMYLEKWMSELKNPSQSSDYSAQGVSSVEMPLEKWMSELKNPSQFSDYSAQDAKCVTDGGRHIGSKCIFPFIYRGIVYNGCTWTDNPQPWCATTVDGNGEYVNGVWGTCPSSCKLHNKDDECVTDGGKHIGAKCIFPFIFDGTKYNGCTLIGHTEPWCATFVDGSGGYRKDWWGNCASSCKLHSKDDECVTDSGKLTGAKCIFPFIYDGTKYNGCTSIGHTQPWCATIVDGSRQYVTDMWGNCASNCKLHSA